MCVINAECDLAALIGSTWLLHYIINVQHQQGAITDYREGNNVLSSPLGGPQTQTMGKQTTQKTKSKVHTGLTFWIHLQLDYLGLADRGGVGVKLKLTEHVAAVGAAVVEGDVADPDGDILQVSAAVPHQAALPRALHHLPMPVPVLVDLVETGN